MFGAGASKACAVFEFVGERQVAVHAQFLLDASACGDIHCFSLAWMRATAVGPVVGPQTLVACTLLDEQLPGGIEEEHGECPMQNPVAVVTSGLVQMTDNVVSSIDENQCFAFG